MKSGKVMKGWRMEEGIGVKEWLKKEVDGGFKKLEVAGTKANSDITIRNVNDR